MTYVKWTANFVAGSILLILSSLVGLYLPLLLRDVIDKGSQLTLVAVTLILLVFLAQAILVSSGRYLIAKSGEELVADTRHQIISHLLHKPLAFFDGQKSGDLSSRIVNDSSTLRHFTVETIPTLISSIITLIGTISVLFILDWQLSLTFLVTFPLLFLVIMPVSSFNEKIASQLQEHISQLNGDLTEHFKEMLLIKANGAEQSVMAKLKQGILTIKTKSLKSDGVDAISTPLVLLLLFASIALIFTYGGQRVARQELSIGTLISFLIYLFQLLNPLGAVADAFSEFAKVKGATKTLEELMTIPQEDLEAGLSFAQSGDIVFDEVSFAYEDRLVLDKISLTIKKGETVAFVGPSGAGKTTLANLLMRLYPVQSGQILIDGTRLEDLSLSSLRRQIGLVSQQSALLSGTMRENLLFGLDYLPTEDEIEKALVLADLWKDMTQFENGLDTDIGEGGKLLSGGQKQRLQIARAYLRQTAYLIFDEATANLDADTEYAVCQSLQTLLKDKTAIIIAHRLSTIVDADRIYFIDNQGITGSGKHEELLLSHPSYARFVEEQML